MAAIVLTSNTTITAGQSPVYLDSHPGAFTVTLPATPTDKQTHLFQDVVGEANVNNILINGNGNQIVGLASINIQKSLEKIKLRWSAASTMWYVVEIK